MLDHDENAKPTPNFRLVLPRCFPNLHSVKGQKIDHKKEFEFNGLVARPKRFELLTPRFVVWCSIQLSYGRMPWAKGHAARALL